jgi:hypothetical protein
MELAADGLVARDMDNCSKSIRVSRCNLERNNAAVNFQVWSIPSPHDANVSGEEISFCATEEMSLRVVSSTALMKCSMGFL